MDNSPAQREPNQPCLNCDTPLNGSFCAECGQEAKEFRRPFFTLSTEAIKSLLELDGRAFSTLFYLLTKPAHLTREYFSGRRARYTPPLRLFLVISVSYFLAVSFYTSIRSMEGMLSGSGAESAASIPVTDEEDVGLPIENEVGEDGDADDGLAAILGFVETINLPFLDEQSNINLRSAMSAQAEQNLNALLEDPADFSRGYLEYITFFILVMIPLLALIQKLIYIRCGHFYVEHLVLTLHNHAFMILVMFILGLTGMVEESGLPVISTLFGYLGGALTIWMWVYFFLSLKNYFQQGYAITLLKYVTTTIIYGFTLGLGVLLFAGILFFLF